MRKIPEDKMEIIRIAVPAVLESLISVVITTIDTRRHLVVFYDYTDGMVCSELFPFRPGNQKNQQ